MSYTILQQHLCKTEKEAIRLKVKTPLDAGLAVDLIWHEILSIIIISHTLLYHNSWKGIYF